MEEEQKKPKPKGGKREGAGRKPKDGVGAQLVSYRINKRYLDIIKTHFNCTLSEFIDKAVKEKLRREGLV